MRRQKGTQTKQACETHQASNEITPDSSTKLDAQAALVAAGIIAFPCDAGESISDPLVLRIRDLRRDRLLAFIAEILAGQKQPQPHKGKN